MNPPGSVGWRLLGVVLTDACNLRCSYCRATRDGRRRLPWDTLRSSLDALLPSAGQNVEVTLTGGEPLLAFATLRLAVSHVEQTLGPQRVLWRIATNGILLDDDKLSFLEEHGFLLNLSFDGIPAAQALRGPATYARLDALLARLRDNHGQLFTERLKVCATVSPETVSHLADSVGYFLEKGVRTFAISPATGAVSWQASRIGELDRQFDVVSAALLQHYERTGQVPFDLFRKSVRGAPPGRSVWTCLVAEGSSPTIDVDGTTYACLRATPTYQRAPTASMRGALEALRLGPAHDGGFWRRVQGLRTAVIEAGAFQHPERRYSSYRTCGDCEFLDECRICPLASASVPGWDDMYRVSDFLCAFNQVALAHRARFPSQPTAEDFLSGRVRPRLVYDRHPDASRTRRDHASGGR